MEQVVIVREYKSSKQRAQETFAEIKAIKSLKKDALLLLDKQNQCKNPLIHLKALAKRKRGNHK